MADYYPLLARALDALPDRSPALRRAVYDRARNALIGQLRSLEPPLPEAAIETEREALDAAIAKLEAAYGTPLTPPASVPPASMPVAAPPPAEPTGLPPAVAPPAKPQPPKPQPTKQPPVEPPVAKQPPAKPEPAKPEPAKPEPSKAPPAAPPPPVAPPAREAPPLPSAPVDLGPPPPPPAPDSAEALPEPGPPVDFVPFVPPPRKAKSVPEPEQAKPEEPDSITGEPAPEAPPAANPAEATNGRQRPRIDVKAPRAERSRLLRNLLVFGILAVVIGLIAVAAYFLRDKPSELPRGGEAESESIGPVPESKLSDRVGGERLPETLRSPPPASTSQPDVAVAQRAVIVEENLADPKAVPPTKTGRVLWRLDTASGEQGQPLQSVIRADIDYPEIGLGLVMTIRKNLDSTLPASHTIELAFSNKDADGKRIVQDIGLLQLKDDERGRGAPVSGLPVRVAENVFLIGLSNLPNDIVRNTEMLRNREWFDIAVQYKPGPRAILAFEKGAVGRQVIESAFEQWR